MSRWIKYCPLVFLIVCGSVQAAEDPAVALGHKLFDAGNYSAAVTEYKRFLCFHPDAPNVHEIYRSIGAAYRSLQQWEKAINAFKQGVESTEADSIRDDLKMEIALSLTAQRSYASAELQLSRLKLFSETPAIVQKARFFLAVIYLQTFEWEKARISFREYYVETPAEYLLHVDSLLSPGRVPEPKSVTTAVAISSILPGSGQWYAGNEGDAVNALSINALFGYLVIDAVVEQRWMDAAIAFTPIFYRYYEGNRRNAEQQVLASNATVNAEYANEVLQIVYSGQK
jgi:tetratricopeptide (TPR) repeat protein